MRIAALALVSAAALVLVGCTPSPHPASSPKPIATPVFRSDAEALAAAEKAYRAYLRASDRAANAGGADLAPIRAFVTDSQWRREERAYEYYTSHHIHSEGTTTLSNSVLESVVDKGSVIVTAYFCVDVTNVRVIDVKGVDVTASNRPNHAALEVRLKSAAPGSVRLLIENSESWSGTGVC